MIPKATILALITTLITLSFQPDILTQWNTATKETKGSNVSSLQDFIKKRELHSKEKLKAEPPKC